MLRNVLRSGRKACVVLAAVGALFFGLSAPLYAQQKLVDPETARTCGCTLRRWPLLSDFLSQSMASVPSLQPEALVPHYVDAGCRGQGPSPGGIYGEVRYSKIVSLDLFIDHDWHDFNLFVKLNGDAHYLNSATNNRNDNRFLCYNQNDKSCPSVKGETLMEVEWDTRHYPEGFWATAGDSVWMTGRYVSDCGQTQ